MERGGEGNREGKVRGGEGRGALPHIGESGSDSDHAPESICSMSSSILCISSVCVCRCACACVGVRVCACVCWSSEMTDRR